MGLAVALAASGIACSAQRPHAAGGGEHPAHDHQPATAHHRFENAEHWARVFEDPERDGWQKPDEVIAALRLPRDAKVADIGAATGYFPIRIARQLPQGTVYGVDVEPNLVEYLRSRAAREGLPNLRPILAKADDPQLPEPVDLVLLVDTYHHLDARSRYFSRLSPRLRPGGRVAIIDFRKGSPFGPPDHHKLAEETVIAEMRQGGFQLDQRHDFLPHQYFLVFSPAD